MRGTDRVRDRDRENFDIEIYIKLISLKSPCYQFKPNGSIFHMKRPAHKDVLGYIQLGKVNHLACYLTPTPVDMNHGCSVNSNNPYCCVYTSKKKSAP